MTYQNLSRWCEPKDLGPGYLRKGKRIGKELIFLPRAGEINKKKRKWGR